MVSHKRGQRRSLFGSRNSILLVQVFRVKVKSAEMCTIVIRPPSKHTCQDRERKGLNPVYFFHFGSTTNHKSQVFSKLEVLPGLPLRAYAQNWGPHPPSQSQWVCIELSSSCQSHQCTPAFTSFSGHYFGPGDTKFKKMQSLTSKNFHTAAQCNKCYKWAHFTFWGRDHWLVQFVVLEQSGDGQVRVQKRSVTLDEPR